MKNKLVTILNSLAQILAHSKYQLKLGTPSFSFPKKDGGETS